MQAFNVSPPKKSKTSTQRERNETDSEEETLDSYSQGENSSSESELDDEEVVSYGPLHHACATGDQEAVEELLNQGADFHIFSEQNNTPIMVAYRYGHEDIVNYLLENGANVNYRDPLQSGETLLILAAEKGDLEMVKNLVENHDARLNDGDCNTFTALHNACLNGHVDVVKYLLEKGANPSIADALVNTPVQIASQKGHADIVALFNPSK